MGDARNNMGNSLLIGCAKMGMDFRIAAPEAVQPSAELIAHAENICEETGGKFLITENIDEAVKALIKPRKTFYPESKFSKQYRKNYELYKELYPTLKILNHRISGL